MLQITAGGLEFVARLEEEAAPQTVAAFRGLLPLASKAGALAGNHFATIVEGNEQLRELGRRMLWEGAQEIGFIER